MSTFREFLYLDDASVDRFLNDGVAPEGGTESPGLSASAGQRFRQLWNEISESPDDTVLEDKKNPLETWTDSSDLQFCTFTGNLSVPSIVGMMSAADELRNFLRIGQQVGLLPISGDEDDMLSKLAAFRDLLRESFPVVLHADISGMPLILHIERARSLVGIDRYRGRATVYGRVIERISEGDKRELLKLPGASHVPQMSRPQRRAAARQGQDQSNINDMTIRGPALALRVLAVEQ